MRANSARGGRRIRRRRPGLLQDIGRTLAREASEIARVQQVLDLATVGACLPSTLGIHFGEAPLAEPCGKCSTCTTGEPIRLPAGRVPEIDPRKWSAALALREEFPVLASPRALTRFLCGLTSPHLTRARQGKVRLLAHPLYRALSHVPFATVLARAEAE